MVLTISSIALTLLFSRNPETILPCWLGSIGIFSASPFALTISANLMCPSRDFLRVLSPFGTKVAMFATFTGKAPGSAPIG